MNRHTERQWTGTEALAWGAISANVQNITGYPGKPITNIINSLVTLKDKLPFHIEWSINEKTAFELGFGAALAGQRSLVIVKHVGMNVLLDSLMTACFTGSNAALVIIVGDDPGATGSQNEQDTRGLGAFAEIPILEPASPQEGYLMIQYAFDLSESLQIPVMIHITSPYSIASEPIPKNIDYNQIKSNYKTQNGKFQTKLDQWKVFPKTAIQYHQRQHAKIQKLENQFEDSKFNSVMRSNIQDRTKIGVVASGFIAYRLRKFMEYHPKLPLHMLKLGTLFPFPKQKVIDFVNKYQTLLILEEGEPFIENHILQLQNKLNSKLTILGKKTGTVPNVDELRYSVLQTVFANVFPGFKINTQLNKLDIPPKYPSKEFLCENCPYTPVLTRIVSKAKELALPDLVVVGDTGCVVRADNPPLQMIDVKYSMGSSIGIGVGIAKALQNAEESNKRTVISLCGDSAFLHSGIQHLINATTLPDLDLLILILDNKTTALTGFQAHPSSPYTIHGDQREPLVLQELIDTLRLQDVRTVNPFEKKEVEQVLDALLPEEGIRVLIVDYPCPLDKNIES